MKHNDLFVHSLLGVVNTETYATLHQTGQMYKLTQFTRDRIEKLAYAAHINPTIDLRAQINKSSLCVILSTH